MKIALLLKKYNMPPFNANLPDPLDPDHIPSKENSHPNPYTNPDGARKETLFSQLLRGPQLKKETDQHSLGSEPKKEATEEKKGIFESGKVSASVFKKEVKKYREGGLVEAQRKALVEEIPTEYGTVYEKKVKGYLKSMEAEKSSADTKRRIEIGKTKDLLKKLMGKE